MNVIGQLIIWLLGTGFIGGVIITSMIWACVLLIINLRREENGKH